MKIDKIKLYILEILLLIVLVLALFESNIITRSVLSIVLLVYMLILTKILKKRKIISIFKKQVMIFHIGFAFIYLAIFYLSGLYFGYYKSNVTFGLWGITRYIIPISIIIISSEIIRFILLSQKSKLSSVITFISMTLIDVILYSQVYDITVLDDFLTIFGFILFASIACNLLYNYTSERFGYWPIIIYRLITGLYSYIIPIIPNVYIFFRSIFRMIYPYIMYLFLEYTYSRNSKASEYKDRKRNVIETAIVVIIITLIAMLVSCRFTYGILVVGSGSMTGVIDKGDAVVYKSYKSETINVGDVIVFNYDNNRIIHRVIKTEIVNDEYRYYTKGDANQEQDNWYITKKDIVGISKFKIKYIGYPTIWVNDIFYKK